MEIKFESISIEQLKAFSLETDYIMTLGISPRQVQEKYGVEFSPLTENSSSKRFAAIREPESEFIFEFFGDAANKTTSVSARGKEIDLRNAYSVFMSTFKPDSQDVSWISESI